MATSAVQGNTFEIEGRKLSIMGVIGYPDGEYWVMNVFMGAFAQVDPDPAKAEIEAIIEQDRENGNEERIDSVRIIPNAAVRLWCEGVLTRKMFENATEDASGVTITVPLAGKDRKVIIQPKENLAYKYATYDADGNVV